MNNIVTKELKKTLKNASRISIRLFEDSAEITCSKDIRKDGYVGNIESKHNGFRASLPTGYNRAFYCDLMYRNNRGNYAALNLIIRAGDELIFRVIDNTNGYMDKAEIPSSSWTDKACHHPDYYGLHNDTLFVTVMRMGKIILTDFEIATNCTPDNSARRLQR